MCYHRFMDQDKIDETVLALLYLGRYEQERITGVVRTWKSFDWDVMERLHEKGLISDPVGKARSVVFTEEGLRCSKEAFRHLFGTE